MGARVRRAFGCLLALPAVIGIASIPAQSQSLPSAKPSPAYWDQWQPETDSADQRLSNAKASAWQQEVTLRDLLSAISAESHVTLAAFEDLQGWHVTALARGRIVASWMLSLAALVDGYWVYRSGTPPDRREYVLVPYADLQEPVEDFLARVDESRAREWHATLRGARNDRLQAYRAALGVPPDELLAKYEASDPWLCGDLVDPTTRPVVEHVAALPESDLEQLMSRGELAAPMRSLAPGFASFLKQWIAGAWGNAACAERELGPDFVPRFAKKEQRWPNASVRIVWSDCNLFLTVEVPDDSLLYQTMAIGWHPGITPGDARRRLARLGWRPDTPEYRAAAEREDCPEAVEKWREASFPRELVARLPGGARPRASAHGDTSSPRLQCEIDLTGAPSRLSLADVLERAAAQSGLPIVASAQPPEAPIWLNPSDGTGSAARKKPTLAQLLQGIRRESISWWFRGGTLVIADSMQRLAEEGRLSDQAVAAWEQLVTRGTAPLEDVLAFLAGLRTAQIWTLAERTSLPRETVQTIYRLVWYAQLSNRQRASLAGEKGITFADLPRQAQDRLLAYARQSRPWLAKTDLAGATAKTVSRKLTSGEEGISLVAEYHLADAPDDHDVIFTTPRAIQFVAPEPRP